MTLSVREAKDLATQIINDTQSGSYVTAAKQLADFILHKPEPLGVLQKAIRYLNTYRYSRGDQIWDEHHAETQALVDLLRSANAPEVTETKCKALYIPEEIPKSCCVHAGINHEYLKNLQLVVIVKCECKCHD